MTEYEAQYIINLKNKLKSEFSEIFYQLQKYEEEEKFNKHSIVEPSERKLVSEFLSLLRTQEIEKVSEIMIVEKIMEDLGLEDNKC